MINYNWGILGPGKIARKFTEDLEKVAGATVYAVASRNKSRANLFAKEFNVVKTYGSYEELVLDPHVDIVYIATPHVFHMEHSNLCLKHNKAVLCEKPFAMNGFEVKQMITLAKNRKVFLMEGMWTHFLPHYLYLLEIIKEKTYGKLLKLEADFGFAAPFQPEQRLYNKTLGGGSLLDVGIYPVFAALSLMGYPSKIKAHASFCSTGVDENCTIEFHYPNGTQAILYSAINEKTPTTAVLEFENATLKLSSRFHEPTSIIILNNGKEKEIAFDVKTRGYNFEAAHVQKMLDEGRTESTLMTFDKSEKLIGLLDSIRQQIQLEY